MLKFHKFAFRSFFLLFKYPRIYSTMEPEKPNLKIIDWKTDTYGDYPFIKSTFRSDRVWTPLPNINEDLHDKEVLVRARIQTVKAKGNICFFTLREGFTTVQACAFKSEATPKEMLKYMGNIPPESIIDLTGKVVKTKNPVESCSQQHV